MFHRAGELAPLRERASARGVSGAIRRRHFVKGRSHHQQNSAEASVHAAICRHFVKKGSFGSTWKEMEPS